MKIEPQRQAAQVRMSLGRRAHFRASVEVTPLGLLAISVLVSGILLSTRVLVRTAISHGEH
ncbi:hypothetical protein [Novosphingobium soli]|uniref:Uncharacterized protein n=1 Tax=Novosphingobium soli TaxID=574956 RepID=A0ABV6CZN9_9SPHN